MKKGWTQAKLARRVGMQQPNIARLEGGNYDRVSLPTLKKVARALGAEIKIKLSAQAEISGLAFVKIYFREPTECRASVA